MAWHDMTRHDLPQHAEATVSARALLCVDPPHNIAAYDPTDVNPWHRMLCCVVLCCVALCCVVLLMCCVVALYCVGYVVLLMCCVLPSPMRANMR